MTIANGQLIDAADLNALTTSPQVLLQTDNAQLPLAHPLTFEFAGLTAALSASNPERCKAVFVMPGDGWVEALCVQAGDFTAASTVTASLSDPGITSSPSALATLPTFPISIGPVAVGAGIVKASRIIFDGTPGRVGTAYIAQNRALRVLKKGSIVVLSVSTTSVATASMLQVTVLLRTMFVRS